MTEDAESNRDSELLAFRYGERDFVALLKMAFLAMISRASTAKDIYGLSIGLRAIERFPLRTEGIGIEIGFNKEIQGHGCNDRFIQFYDSLDEYSFGTSETIDCGAGTDTALVQQFVIGPVGRNGDFGYIELEEWVSWFLNDARDETVSINVSDDDSSIDWYDEDCGDALWDDLPEDEY
jgi:hypothetical protein